MLQTLLMILFSYAFFCRSNMCCEERGSGTNQAYPSSPLLQILHLLAFLNPLHVCVTTYITTTDVEPKYMIASSFLFESMDCYAVAASTGKQGE